MEGRFLVAGRTGRAASATLVQVSWRDAAAIRSDGEAELIAAGADEDDEHPEPAAVLEACFAALTEMRDEIRAGAVVSDVSTGDGGEAISVDLEHAEGQSFAVVLPYVKGDGGRPDYGELKADGGRPQIWV